LGAAQTELERIIHQGADAAKAREKIWDDIDSTIDRKARIAHVEHRCKIDLGVMIESEKVLALFLMLLDSAKQVLEDRLENRSQAAEVFREINRRMLQVMGPR
jgi:hypothetical protein